jgi:hypothetical protein
LSLRINLGAAFRELFKGEEVGINVVFYVYDSKFEMFYKDDEKYLFTIFKKSADMRMDGVIALKEFTKKE